MTKPTFSNRRAAGLVFLVAVAVYLNSLAGEFVFDDTSVIQSNPQIRSLGWTNLTQIFGSHYWQTVAGQGGLYRPVVILSYALNYAAGGLDPWGYHLVNVVLHALAAVLVYAVIEELFREARFSLWSGLLFALHPIRTEAVAYLTGRAEILAALFFLAAWRCHLLGRWALGAGAFLLAALSKESAFTLPAVLLLGDWAGRRRFDPPRYAPFVAMAVAALGLRYLVLGGLTPLAITPSANPVAAAPTPVRLMTATEVAGRYLGLLILPVGLSADYSYNQIPPVSSPRQWSFVISLAALAAVAAGTVWAGRRGARALVLCGSFFFATFSLTSNFLRPIGTIMAERLMYLPSLGFTCACAWLVSRARQPGLAVAGGVLLAGLWGARTVARNADWREHLSLFSSAAVTSPDSSLVRANLAHALLRKGDASGAAEQAREAIRIEPGDPAAHMTLAHAYQSLGDWSRAVEAYARVEQLAPGTAGGQEAARRRQALLRRLGGPG